MSFAAINYDFSQLPKVRAHAQLGRLGDPSGCSIFDPTSYGTCATWIIQARTELADAHNQILDLANGWASAVQEIQFWPDSESKQEALATAQAQLQAATALVQAHTQVQNEFESKIQPYVNIGLAGLWKSGPSVGRLGILPAWLILTASSLIVSGLLAWGISSAMALKSNYDAQAAYYNQFTSYYQTCRDLAAQGKPCNLPAPSDQGPGTAWGSSSVTWAVLIGLGALVIFNLTRR
jgi:hypothetical protein